MHFRCICHQAKVRKQSCFHSDNSAFIVVSASNTGLHPLIGVSTGSHFSPINLLLTHRVMPGCQSSPAPHQEHTPHFCVRHAPEASGSQISVGD